ncbi:hypothetical protein NIES2100_20040 [Calothrix sp. NIES-2100]|uniref:hypothetical protein n=1 Tax=Calothrix sp. NIES-2100 TaxID=1954172 RepID=UPI000B621E5F|nr:hypothetical protein NIES2100_20040 [Calothrix sp. NIES-2100]
MAKEASAATTVMSVIALVFGIIGMLASFIPCLGAFAFWLALPSSLLGGLATYLAYSKGESKVFPLVALTISTIGLVISGTQMIALNGASHSIQQGIQQGLEQRR